MNSLADNSTARSAGSKLSSYKGQLVPLWVAVKMKSSLTSEEVVGYSQTKHREREHFLYVKEVRKIVVL